MKRIPSTQPAPLAELVALVYELLDAHSDTAELVGCSFEDVCWPAHLDYLRALQRKARGLLAVVLSSERSAR